MSVIEVNQLTKDYGHNHGIFDVSFTVNKGETLGFLGPNGAGKSTTMRHLMGFSKAHQGRAAILDLDCRKDYARIMEQVGYLPGEVALPEGLDGKGFLKIMKGLHKSKTDQRLKELLEIFPVDLKQKVKRMSIGEKRKLAVLAAFMDDPDILLLDEPTSGLDPMMQEKFIDLIKKEKQRGKTILLSSHIFSEVEALCDRIAIIKDGRIVTVVDAAQVRHGLRKIVEITFKTNNDYRRFLQERLEIAYQHDEDRSVGVYMEDAKVNDFLDVIVKYDVASFTEKPVTLEDYFMHFYKSEKTFGGVGDEKNN